MRKSTIVKPRMSRDLCYARRRQMCRIESGRESTSSRPDRKLGEGCGLAWQMSLCSMISYDTFHQMYQYWEETMFAVSLTCFQVDDAHAQRYLH